MEHVESPGTIHRLHHQLIELVKYVLQFFRFPATERWHLLDQGLFAEVVADHGANVPIQSFVAADPGPREIGDLHVSGRGRPFQTWHAKPGAGSIGLCADAILIAAIDHIHRQLLSVLKEKHLVLIAMQILWARQGNPHGCSQKAVLTDLGAHGAGGEQHDQRIILITAELMQRSAELLQTLLNWSR